MSERARTLLHVVRDQHTARSSLPGDTAIYMYVKPRTGTRFAERGFWSVGPDACDNVSPHLHCINDTAVFKRKLNTELYTQGDSDVILFRICVGLFLPPSCR